MGEDITQPDSNESSGDQPINWESRFKGLQRTLNERTAEVQATNSALLDLKRKYNEDVNSNVEALRTAKAEAVRFQADLETQKAQSQALEERLATTQQKLELQEAMDSARKLIVSQNASDLLPFFEKG